MKGHIVKDYLVRVLTKEGDIRALACVTTGLVKDACRRQGTYPTASAALGRALTGGALMGALLKSRERVALMFQGDGPLRKILIEAESNGAVRGYVRVPDVDLPPRNGKIDVGGAVGRQGLLTVTKDLNLKEPYKSVVQLYTGEIAEDLAYYLTESEQIPSAVGLGVFVEENGEVSASGGFLVQSMPTANDPTIERMVEGIRSMPPITQMLRNGNTPETLLEQLFNGIDYDILEKRELMFRCSCSKERVERALIALGQQEIGAMIEEEALDVVCEFCRQSYVINREDLERLSREIH
jgi:molecular chaperone Hsp33